MTQTLRQMPREIAALMPYRPVEVLAIAPSQSLDALAQRHAGELPAGAYNALAGLGALGPKAARVALRWPATCCLKRDLSGR